MGFFLMLFVCFLAQCVFVLSDEHLLVLLIIFLALFFSETIFSFVHAQLYERQVAAAKQVIKTRLLNVFFVKELDKLFDEFEGVVHTAFSLNIELYDSLPLLISETCDQLSFLYVQTQIANFLEISVNQIADELSETELALLDLSISEFIED